MITIFFISFLGELKIGVSQQQLLSGGQSLERWLCASIALLRQWPFGQFPNDDELYQLCFLIGLYSQLWGELVEGSILAVRGPGWLYYCHKVGAVLLQHFSDGCMSMLGDFPVNMEHFMAPPTFLLVPHFLARNLHPPPFINSFLSSSVNFITTVTGL